MVAGTGGVNGAGALLVTLPLAVQVAPAVGRLFGRDGRDARAPWGSHPARAPCRED